MKHSSVFNIFLIALLIIGCSSNENTSAYCPEDGCLLERNNPNERFSETAEQPVETDFEAMETSNDFPFPPKAETLKFLLLEGKGSHLKFPLLQSLSQLVVQQFRKNVHLGYFSPEDIHPLGSKH